MSSFESQNTGAGTSDTFLLTISNNAIFETGCIYQRPEKYSTGSVNIPIDWDAVNKNSLVAT